MGGVVAFHGDLSALLVSGPLAEEAQRVAEHIREALHGAAAIHAHDHVSVDPAQLGLIGLFEAAAPHEVAHVIFGSGFEFLRTDFVDEAEDLPGGAPVQIAAQRADDSENTG